MLSLLRGHLELSTFFSSIHSICWEKGSCCTLLGRDICNVNVDFGLQFRSRQKVILQSGFHIYTKAYCTCNTLGVHHICLKCAWHGTVGTRRTESVTDLVYQKQHHMTNILCMLWGGRDMQKSVCCVMLEEMLSIVDDP